MNKTGLMLINLGTPNEPTTSSVRSYLREFLSDPLVYDDPFLIRWCLLNFIILPFRPRKSAKAYQAVWTDRGSPLRFYSDDLAQGLQQVLGDEFQVELAMRYGKPSIPSAVQRLKESGCTHWLIAPLYPQYALSTTESSWRAVSKAVHDAFLGEREPELMDIGVFYDNDHYIRALSRVTSGTMQSFEPDYLLMSYHGLPERQLAKPVCLECKCDRQTTECPPVNEQNKRCYRAHCFATSRALALSLGLSEESYGVSFQSRLGRIPWIGPDTESVLEALYERGVRRLAVVMPAFVSDCLETLEEIGMELKANWERFDGASFCAVPCLNADQAWLSALRDMVIESLPVRYTDYRD